MTHTLKTAQRIHTVHIQESPNAVTVSLTCSQYGRCGDEAALAHWIASLVFPYENDRRPLIMENGRTVEKIVIMDTRRPVSPVN